MRSKLARAKLVAARFSAVVILLAAVYVPGIFGQDGSGPDAVIVADYSNPGATPSHWTLTLHRDGTCGGILLWRVAPEVPSDFRGQMPALSRDRCEKADPVLPYLQGHSV